MKTYQDQCFFFFPCMLRDNQMRKMFKKNENLGIAGVGIKWKYKWCLQILLKLRICKYSCFQKTWKKQIKRTSCFRFGTICIILVRVLFLHSHEIFNIFSENEFSQIVLFLILWSVMSEAKFSCWVMVNKYILTN